MAAVNKPLWGALLATLWTGSGTALAQGPVAEFYKGKTINMLIGTVVGGEFDLHARLVARFIGKHIPGNPTVVPQNMAGGGGVRMTNYFYQAAARDGTQLAVINSALPFSQVLGVEGVQFDLAKFNWIGSIAPSVETMVVWRTTGVASLEEAKAKEVIVGTSGKGSFMYTFPKMLNEMLGTKFKIVVGYAGGNDVNMAMERGEVYGRNNTWSSWKATKPEWLKKGDIRILAYAGPPPKDLPGVPNVESLARNDDDRRVMALIVSGARLGRPMTTNQNVPAERVKALRDAFDAAMKDPEFSAAAKQARVEPDPIRGIDLQRIVTEVLTTPKPLVERARKVVD